MFKFQSTPPSREATNAPDDSQPMDAISIHAPLTGGDDNRLRLAVILIISIHAPLTGGDIRILLCDIPQSEFQSTPPSREATMRALSLSSTQIFQSTPPSREATPRALHQARRISISIHAPLTGGDPSGYFTGYKWKYFNPRPPHGRRQKTAKPPRTHIDFNPRPPHGRRRLRCASRGWRHDFNPRPPHGRRRS